MADMTNDNKKLQEVHQKAEATAADLQRKLANYDKDKMLLVVSVR